MYEDIYEKFNIAKEVFEDKEQQLLFKIKELT